MSWRKNFAEIQNGTISKKGIVPFLYNSMFLLFVGLFHRITVMICVFLCAVLQIDAENRPDQLAFANGLRGITGGNRTVLYRCDAIGITNANGRSCITVRTPLPSCHKKGGCLVRNNNDLLNLLSMIASVKSAIFQFCAEPCPDELNIIRFWYIICLF